MTKLNTVQAATRATDTAYCVTVYRRKLNQDDTILATWTAHADSPATVRTDVDKALDGKLDAHTLVAVYPAVADAQDGDGILALAAYVQRAERRWRVRNGNATMSAMRETVQEQEDAQGTAALAIVAHMAETPDWTVHSCYRAAFRAVTGARTKLYRIKECTYLPGWSMCNPDLSGAMRDRHTLPRRLAEMVETAVEVANLTKKQDPVIKSIMVGIGQAEYCQMYDIKKASYYDARKAAFARIASALVAMPDFGDYMRRAGWTLTDSELTDIAAALVERAAVSLKSKKRKASK